jgi:hypothetical protein
MLFESHRGRTILLPLDPEQKLCSLERLVPAIPYTKLLASLADHVPSSYFPFARELFNQRHGR